MRLLWWSYNLPLPSFWCWDYIWWVSKLLIDKECTFVSGSDLLHLMYTTAHHSFYLQNNLFKFCVCCHFLFVKTPSLPPLTTSSPTHWWRVWWGACHCWCGDTASHAEYLQLDITLTREGGVTPLSEQVGGVTHTSFFDSCYCLSARSASLPLPRWTSCGGGCICGVSAE